MGLILDEEFRPLASEGREAGLERRVRDLERLQSVHLDALRRVSAALGDPFAGDLTRDCTDLGAEAARQLAEARAQQEGNIDGREFQP